MANIEKHVRSLPELLMDSDSILVPTRARSAHLIARYIKGGHRGRHAPSARTRKLAPPYVLKLEGVRANRETVERVQRRVEAINRWLDSTRTPFRLRLIAAPKP